MKQDFYHRESCRACGSKDIIKFLDLGKMPPANSFLRKDEVEKEEKKFPLAVYFCKNCALVQLLDVVNPELLFKNYHYMTSASKPLAKHFENLASEVSQRFLRNKDELVVEIGSNDGTLLSFLKSRCKVLGIEPSENLADIAEKNGVPTIKKFFSSKLAEEILKENSEAKVVLANNVVAHIDDLKDLFLGVKKLIGKNGVFVFEAHWVGNLIGAGGFDQIYHEHLCYFSLTALKNFCDSLGMKIVDAEFVKSHGESLRVFVSNSGGASDEVQKIFDLENNLKLDSVQTYFDFSKRVEKNRLELISLLKKLKSEGKRISGYGAPAKGNTLLNFCGIDGKILDYISDSTPFKQNLYTPGAHIEIFSPEKFKQAKSDYALLLAWNYADEILAKEKDFMQAGGKFIIPVPQVKIAQSTNFK